jgi:asparagine synthase (glutamine-hydrolysing)
MARETGGHVKTYSVGFEEGADAIDESHDAAQIARHLETDHTRVLVRATDMVAHLDRFIAGLDQPSVDGLNSYFVSYAASQGVTVSLSGTGADELFLGYPWFAAVQSGFLDANPPPDGAKAQTWTSRLPFIGRFARRAAADTHNSAGLREAFGRQYHCFGPAAAHDLLAPAERNAVRAKTFAEDLAQCDELPNGDLLERTSVICLNGYTRNQLLRDIDACSMAHSLEVRVPFLDVAVADFAFSVPSASKLAMSEHTLDPAASYADSGVKRIVCDVARKYLPAAFFDTRAKRGFGLPFTDWLKGPLAEVLSDTLSPASVSRAGLFDPASVTRIHKDFLAGRRPWSHAWLLMVTELWRRRVLQP